LFLFLPHHLLGRFCLFVAILALEALFAAASLGVEPVFHIHLFSAATVSFALFLGLSYPWLKVQRETIPFGRILFGAYLACIAAEICIYLLAVRNGTGAELSHGATLAIIAILLLRLPLLALACVPLRIFVKMIRATSPVWLYAAIAGLAAGALKSVSWSPWHTVSANFFMSLTLRSVQPLLCSFLPNVVVDEASWAIGTPRFSVRIASACSGIEGMGLVLVFCGVWLWFFRKKFRFPQAFLLVPCALGCIWMLNVVRLFVLILIGDAISPDVALVGFHSRAGWIAFILVALAFCMAAEKLPWVQKAPSSAFGLAGQPRSSGRETDAGVKPRAGQSGESPAIRAYLIPFLAILAASFISKAASGYFEWLYPLRFVAAAVAIWYFWPELKKLNWRFGWVAPLAGVAVFLAWIAPALWSHQFAASKLGPVLAALSPTARWTWIAFRVAAAVITVPIAEELAFRGYLARRFMSRDFDSIPFSSLTVFSILLSSAAFGLMHGQHWVVGIVAGLAYAAALRWRGRMGDAIVAHALSNLLLAAWVLVLGDWAQW
jgi:exosortase E/protease (VPEID-CTERM system)